MRWWISRSISLSQVQTAIEKPHLPIAFDESGGPKGGWKAAVVKHLALTERTAPRPKSNQLHVRFG
jgi:hypothetical protein